MPGVGCHTRLADGPFALLMKELGIQPPDLNQKPDDLDMDWFKWLLDYSGKRKERDFNPAQMDLSRMWFERQVWDQRKS